MTELNKISKLASNGWPWVAVLSVSLMGCGDGTSETKPPMASVQFGATMDGSLAMPLSSAVGVSSYMSRHMPTRARFAGGPLHTMSGPIPTGLGCISFVPNGKSLTVNLNGCIIETAPLTTLSGTGTAAYDQPSFDVTIDGTVESSGVAVNVGGEMHWDDLGADLMPEFTLHAGATTPVASANITELKLVLEKDGYTGMAKFNVDTTFGYGISSDAIVLVGDAESFTISGPVVANALGVEARGEARDIAIRYTELRPHGGNLKATVVGHGWTLEQRTYFQPDTPASGWVLVHELARGTAPNDEPVDSDSWKCINLGTFESHQASEGATCPVI